MNGKRRRRVAGLVLAGGLATVLMGCPYDADIEPSGHLRSLRSVVVGAWVCDLNGEASWADLTIGWTHSSMYLLTLRIRRPDEGEPRSVELRGRPLQVGHHEIWSVSSEDPGADPSGGKYSFLRFESAQSDSLRLAVLGGSGGDMHGHLDEADPGALARFLQDPEETRVESRVLCRR